MQQQYPVQSILHSKLETNGQQKYLIRWMGEQPIGNITSDVIEEFDKRKVLEKANEHLAKVSVYSIQVYFLLFPFCLHVSLTLDSFLHGELGCHR